MLSVQFPHPEFCSFVFSTRRRNRETGLEQRCTGATYTNIQQTNEIHISEIGYASWNKASDRQNTDCLERWMRWKKKAGFLDFSQPSNQQLGVNNKNDEFFRNP